MDIKQLYYFTAVAQAGSYSKAAESLAVSQPTLSVTVKKLEEELGVQLFYAFNREQHLTDEGLRLWTKAKQILDLYQETLDDMKTTNKNSSGKFTLGLSPLFGACFFGDLIPNFSMEYPNIEIKMIEDGAYRIDQRIERGEVDIAVTLNSKRLSSFAYCHFSTQRNVALLHKSHPLAKEPSVTVSQLRDDSFAIFNQDFILHEQIVDACHAAGFRPKFALLSSQWDFMVELVSKNHAVSILPKPVPQAPPPAVSRSPWTLWRITLFRCPRPPAFLWRCSTGLAPSPAAD